MEKDNSAACTDFTRTEDSPGSKTKHNGGGGWNQRVRDIFSGVG